MATDMRVRVCGTFGWYIRTATVPMDSDDEMRAARKTEKQWSTVAGETDAGLTSTLFVERAYKLRDRAKEIFEYEKQRILDNPRVSEEAKAHLHPYVLVFDRGTRRRGVCKYPSATRRAHIGLSARMVDNAVSAAKIVNIKICVECGTNRKEK